MKVLVHYHEIALKGRNRPFFLGKLADNLRRATEDLPGARVKILPGRMSVDIPDGVPWDLVRERVAAVFGIANFAPAHEVALDLAALKTAAVASLRGRTFGSFRVTTKRSYKGFPRNSGEIDREVGAAVHEATGVRVDLEHPELTLFVEVLQDRIFYSYEKQKG